MSARFGSGGFDASRIPCSGVRRRCFLDSWLFQRIALVLVGFMLPSAFSSVGAWCAPEALGTISLASAQSSAATVPENEQTADPVASETERTTAAGSGRSASGLSAPNPATSEQRSDDEATAPSAEPDNADETNVAEPSTADEANIAVEPSTADANPEIESGANIIQTEVDDDEAQEHPPLPIRGSIFNFQQGLSVDSLNPDARLTYNPSYYWSFFLQLRYYLESGLYFLLSESASIEWTDSDSSTVEREFQFSDLVLEMRRNFVLDGFILIPSIRVAAPLSTASQAADRILNLGVSLTAVKSFPELANLTLAGFVTYRHWFAMTNVTTTTDTLGGSPSPYFCSQGALSSTSCDQVGSQTTERDRLALAVTMTVMPLDGFSINTQYAFAWSAGFGLADAPVDAVGGPDTLPDQSTTHWRNLHYWTLYVAYDVIPWINLALGYQSAPSYASVLQENGTVRNVFYNEFSELYLSATLSIEGLIDSLTDRPEDLTPEERQRRRQGLASSDSRPRF